MSYLVAATRKLNMSCHTLGGKAGPVIDKNRYEGHLLRMYFLSKETSQFRVVKQQQFRLG